MTDLSKLRPGLVGHAELLVGEEHTAPRIGSGRVRVLATPVGMRVRATARLLSVEGRTLEFQVEAHDEKDLIGDGSHQRLVVNVARFDQRVQAKLARG